MRLSRVYVDQPLAGARCVDLGGTAAHHIARVLRLGAGDVLTLFDGRGGEYAGTIESSGRNRVTVALGAHSPTDRESRLELTLAQGISRTERMDLVVQKATELGVAAIVPISAARSVVRMDEKQSARKLEHWRSIAIAACEQCGRNRLPSIKRVMTVDEWLAGRLKSGVALTLSGRAGKSLREVLAHAQSTKIDLLIGPEGGLDACEEAAALGAGFVQARLGPRVLRTETAALAALAAIQSEFGDF